MNTFEVTSYFSGAVFVIFLYIQLHYFLGTRKARHVFENFFDKKSAYSKHLNGLENDQYPQIDLVGNSRSDLNMLIQEINTYLFKTKGTSDYEFIRNKVERKLNMRYDQSTVHLSFPTYIGLMGTFSGVFMGILMFLAGFDANSISDESIKNLLMGVLVSMSTSLVGLLLTTINTGLAGEARKKIEDNKNEFYDFIQTEVTKTASASLVTAISKLHDTVDKFEPTFSTVIDGFKTAFSECTRAFGDDFKENVRAVTSAVDIMGGNMDKINENIDLQKQLLDRYRSSELVLGMEKYIEAADHFVGITQSLNKFEEARRMMLAAAQEAIQLQNQYSDSLRIPKEVAVSVNQILDRIKVFEQSINHLGDDLSRREILGNDIVNKIDEQIKAIGKKNKIADRYVEIADNKLDDLYREQTKAIDELNIRYRNAISTHIEGFEDMLKVQTKDLEKRHKDFMQAIEDRFNVEDVRQEFTNLKKLGVLDQIEKSISTIGREVVKPEVIKKDLADIQKQLQSLKEEIKTELSAINKNTKDSRRVFSLFGGSKK